MGGAEGWRIFVLWYLRRIVYLISGCSQTIKAELASQTLKISETTHKRFQVSLVLDGRCKSQPSHGWAWNGKGSSSWLRASEVSSIGAARWSREVSILSGSCADNHSCWLSCHVQRHSFHLVHPAPNLWLLYSNPLSKIVRETWREGHGTHVPFVPEHSWPIDQLWLPKLATIHCTKTDSLFFFKYLFLWELMYSKEQH